MKSKSLFVPIFSTFLITAAALISYYFLCLKPDSVLKKETASFEFLKASAPAFRSRPIDWKKAKIYIEELKGHHLLQVSHKGISGKDPVKKETLTGFVFEARHLDSIINNNPSIAGKPDKVAFYLGQSGTVSTTTGDFDHGIIKIIAVGIKNGQLIIDNNAENTKTPGVYDHADPCPPFCPKDPVQ